jgi:hypothetical protein
MITLKVWHSHLYLYSFANSRMKPTLLKVRNNPDIFLNESNKTEGEEALGIMSFGEIVVALHFLTWG